MKILSSDEMQACDRTTTERFGIPSIELMRAASRALADFAREQFPNARRVTVLCGRGNNGGDGLMAARLLAESGLDVTTILLGAPDALKGDAAQAWAELIAEPHGRTHVVTEPAQLEMLTAALATDLILDAILGTGFTPPIRSLALAAIEWARATAPILAVDLPSGWPADSTASQHDGPFLPADAVFTFTAPKPAHVFGQLTRSWRDPVAVASIGSPDEAIVSKLSLTWAGASKFIVETPRPADSNKGRFGHVLVLGGAVGKAGAPAMAALAAMRAGAGLVTAATPAPVLSTVAGFAPELMTAPLPATPTGELAEIAPDALAELLKGKSVVAVGPGLGQGTGARALLAALLDTSSIPLVIDADALNLIAADAVLLAALAAQGRAGRTLVLTPHPGEMARLAATSIAAIQSDRLTTARTFAQQHAVTLVLKGTRTLIAQRDGHVAVNTSGNPALAKGGSGDMLTGWIASLLAQHPAEPARAVEAAVYLHGLAADLAVQRADEHTLLATDTLRTFSRAFRFRQRGPSGYVLLQGLRTPQSRARGNQ
ncbi:MAG: NAD(P)H-hydrate dehydratase [Terracidiphilus sp.]|nr:NAD(P)H-hydrate dehydratase [Terracidiphilus sp.]